MPVAKMNFLEKLQAAIKGSREMRAILIRGPAKVIALSMATVSVRLLPRLNDRDVAMLSIDRNVPDPLRMSARKKVIGTGR
jgi:hypothetical protein